MLIGRGHKSGHNRDRFTKGPISLLHNDRVLEHRHPAPKIDGPGVRREVDVHLLIQRKLPADV